jgi:glycosyltransferase involved in cell wall biosynthesis
MVGLPVVASHVESYAHSIVNGENGFIAKNSKDWLKYLRRLVEDAELRDEMGRAAKQLAESRTIDKNIALWEKAYGLSVEAVK